MLRDVVLEGARAAEIEALAHLSAHPEVALPPPIAQRLRAKGWIDTAGDSHLLTIAGRTLVENR